MKTRNWMFALGALAGLVLATQPAAAVGPCEVTSSADDGPGSLREKIADVNCDPITFNVPGGVITLTTDKLTIGRNLTITGPGADQLTIQRDLGATAFRIFYVPSSFTVSISGLHIANGIAATEGGGIQNLLGTVTLSNLSFSNNHGVSGGAIYNFRNMTVKNSTFFNNTASFNGGAILNTWILTLENNTFFGNTALVAGAIANNATATITNSTISGNAASGGTAGGLQNLGALTVKNTIIANSTSGGNCGGNAFTDGGGNLSSDATCQADYHNVDPMLGALAPNGGTTQTMALGAGSPALDVAVAANCPAKDQRGVDRPQGAGCDIGAYELIPVTGWTFSGFLGPVSSDDLNIAKAGQGIAVKFMLDGDKGLNIFASGYPASQQVACPLSEETSTVTETAGAGNSGLTYDPVTQIYTYIWKTQKSWANSCRELVIQFADTAHTTIRTNFAFTK